MSILRRIVQRGGCARTDSGFTLVEGLVAMVIFMSSMAVLSSVVLAMTNNMRQAHGVSIATDQARLAFQRLDKQVRYATAIGNPGPAPDGAYYMEFSTLDTGKDSRTSAAPKNTRCHQWRVKSELLQTRSWEVTPPPASQPYRWTDWQTVATGIMNDVSLGAERPFDDAPLYTGYVHRGLEVSLYVKRSDRPLGRAQLKSRFFARNTDLATYTPNVCRQIARTALTPGGPPS